jgi:hypothetical protein
LQNIVPNAVICCQTIETNALLGSRHVAVASITKQTKSIAVVVSESSVVRIFDRGESSLRVYQSCGYSTATASI